LGKCLFLKLATEKPGHDLATEQMADDKCEVGIEPIRW
jgi:hypothetical protein